MTIPCFFKRRLMRRRFLSKALTFTVLVALLAGLIPLPAIYSGLPFPATQLADALLSKLPVARAADTTAYTNVASLVSVTMTAARTSHSRGIALNAVPDLATSTPTTVPTVPTVPTNTPTATVTDTPTSTPTLTVPTVPTLPTETPTPTVTDTPTNTLTPTPTDTPLATPTVTDTPMATPTVTDTVTETPTATNTPTNTPTRTPTVTPTTVVLLHLGNLVWYDQNNNGLVDAGESGIAGVTVHLFRAGDDPTMAIPLATDVTDAQGFYLFENLPPGRYFVYLPTPPALYLMSSTPTDNADNGEDNDDNGIQTTAGGAVRSPVVELTVGGEPTTDGDNANGDLTIDFGFWQSQPDLVLVKQVSTEAELILPGLVVTYSLTYSNVGTAIAVGVIMTETVSPYTTFVVQASTPGWSCANGVIAGTKCTLALGMWRLVSVVRYTLLSSWLWTSAPVLPFRMLL